VALALVVVLHAALTKGIWGPSFATIGLARGLSLLLGLSLPEFGPGPMLPTAAAVALFATGWALLRVSRQPGAPPSTPLVAMVHLVCGLGVFLYVYQRRAFHWLDALPFLIAAIGLTLPRLVESMADPRRPAALAALQWTFIGLTLFEATLVAGARDASLGAVVAGMAIALYALLRRWPFQLVTEPR
jgi:hypothetical protein